MKSPFLVFFLVVICAIITGINLAAAESVDIIKRSIEGVWEFVSQNDDNEKSSQCGDTIFHKKVAQYKGFIPGNNEGMVVAVRWRDLVINEQQCMTSDLASTATIFETSDSSGSSSSSSSSSSAKSPFFIKGQDNSPRKCGNFVQEAPSRYYVVNNLPNVTDLLVNDGLITGAVKGARNGDLYMLSQQFRSVHVLSKIVCLYKKRTVPTGGANATDRGRACFPGLSTVLTRERGRVHMHSLRVGDHVLVDEVRNVYSAVYFFSHRERYNRYRYYTVYLSTGFNVTLSEGHFVHTQNYGMQSTGKLRVGDRLHSGVIVDIRRGVAAGLYAPHTRHGSLLVDGVFVSSYTTAIPPRVAHNALVPLRALYAASKLSIEMPSVVHTVYDFISLIIHAFQNLHLR